MTLFQKLQEKVHTWRETDYACAEYPELREIITYQKTEEDGFRFLRKPQFETIETYIYVRYILKTPHVIDLYKTLFQDNEELFKALGIQHINKDTLSYVKAEEVLQGIKENKDDIVNKYKYNTLQETLQIDYASYILALVMGAGKTILIGTIIAIEFAIALSQDERGDEDDTLLMKNALITAKGTTIIESLREIASMDFSNILPPRLYKKLAPNLKIHYTTQNDKAFDGVQQGSLYNILVTNNEKIILKKRESRSHGMFAKAQKEEQRKLESNTRLQKITSLPDLAVFSDEAHNTYGQETNKELKRVRETINHIHTNKELVCVVNTTGTPYYQKQTLKEVIYWYSLEQGIKGNILKSVQNNIVSYSFEQESEDDIISKVVEDFFNIYQDVKLETGQQSKIAFYFKTIAHLQESKKVIEKTLTQLSLSTTLILVNIGESSKRDIEEFNALNNPDNQKRIILLVGKGIEGWNCPSLFSTALIKEQTKSNTFILQASSRCLRQVKNNTMPAKMYLSSKNIDVLNKELQSAFNMTVNEMNGASQQKECSIESIIQKESIPKLVIKKKVKRIERIAGKETLTVSLTLPNNEPPATFKHIYRLENSQLKESDTGEKLPVHVEYCGLYNIAAKLAENYHIAYINVLSALKKLYPDGSIPRYDIEDISQQIEKQVSHYQEIEELVTQALAIIKLKDAQGNYNFAKHEKGYLYHTIRYKEDTLRQRLITHHKDYLSVSSDIGFHMSVYDFDSHLEKNFFDKLFNILQVDKKKVEDIYFTGSITDTDKTDIYFEYKTEKGRFAPYYPDFVIRKKDQRFLIVELKSTRDRNLPDVIEKEKAIQNIASLNTDIFKYIIVCSDNENISDNNTDWHTIATCIE